MVLFEGSEKKLEVTIDARHADLRDLGMDFWQQIVQASNAEIISTIYSPVCEAHLLSESSLFVWNHRFIMITCGKTRLIEAAILFLKNTSFPIASLFYQRKNEFFPNLQHSNFDEDVSVLQQYLCGNIFQLGEKNSHHIFYHQASHHKRKTNDPRDDTTIELKMFHLGQTAETIFLAQNPEAIHTLFQDTKLWQIFDIDEFFFEPFGYSVNGLNNDRYFTIHVTPQNECSYASFETNLPLPKARNIIQILLTTLRPKTFDTLIFSTQSQTVEQEMEAPIIEQSIQSLGNLYDIYFHQYQSNHDRKEEANSDCSP